jgi:small subunit ribosomal protein S20
MPITNSAKKALRQNLKRRKINAVKKRKIKNLIKETRVLISQNKTEEAKKLLPKIYKILDKTAKSGLIKKNTASRKKSRITALINKSQIKKS